MFGAVAEFVATQQGDSAEFVEKARAVAIGVARDTSLLGSTWFASTTGLGHDGCTLRGRSQPENMPPSALIR
jgi:hypothetical protein